MVYTRIYSVGVDLNLQKRGTDEQMKLCFSPVSDADSSIFISFPVMKPDANRPIPIKPSI